MYTLIYQWAVKKIATMKSRRLIDDLHTKMVGIRGVTCGVGVGGGALVLGRNGEIDFD